MDNFEVNFETIFVINFSDNFADKLTGNFRVDLSGSCQVRGLSQITFALGVGRCSEKLVVC